MKTLDLVLNVDIPAAGLGKTEYAKLDALYSRLRVLASICYRHGVSAQYTGVSLIALDVACGRHGEDCSAWVDISAFTVRGLYGWLGY